MPCTARLLINQLRASHKKKVDRLVAQRYNISGISGYAEEMYDFEIYDEVYTEYRTKILLKGEP